MDSIVTQCNVADTYKHYRCRSLFHHAVAQLTLYNILTSISQTIKNELEIRKFLKMKKLPVLCTIKVFYIKTMKINFITYLSIKRAGNPHHSDH